MKQQSGAKRHLWLKVLQGDMRTVTRPTCVRDCIAICPQHRLVVVDRSLLSLGLFTGRTQGCHLRLRSLNEAPPQFCLQYDERDRWTLVGVGGLVFVNGDLIREETVELKFDDELICDPYVIKVIPRLPNGLSEQDSVPTIESETTLSSLSDTSFVLNLPPARKDSKTLNAGVVPPSSGDGWQCQ